jgi:hypothetical protein
MSMNAAQLLILFAGVGVSGVTFVLMRYPQARREQFRSDTGFSLAVSAGVAIAMLAAFSGLACLQGGG